MRVPTYTAEMDQQLYHDVLNQQLQQNVSQDGFVMPSRTTADIAAIASPDNTNGRPDGAMWYDQDLKKLVIKQDGVVVQVNTSPL